MLACAGLAAGWQAAVSTVEVRGAQRLAVERVIELSGLKPGQAVDKAVLQSAVERMMATGHFQRVTWRTQPGEDGVKVTFSVVEAAVETPDEAPASGPKIERVELRGVAAERAARVRLALEGAMVGRDYKQDAVEEVGGPLVRAALAESGHWTPVVKFAQGDKGVLVVKIDEGPVAVLGAVGMTGGEVKWGELAGFVKGAPAESGKLNQALGRVLAAARNDGYLNATVRSTQAVDRGELKLTIHVEKGPQYRFGELKIDGLTTQAEARARKLWVLKPGDPASTAALEEWIRRVFERRIPVWDRAQREWRPRAGEAVADAVVSFK
jgi:outer membrane translocation and assembly module TamA